MRKGARTLRGSLQANEIRQLVVDDGIFTNGLRVTYFTVWTSDIPTASSAVGCLSLSDTIVPVALLPANDPSCFAWSMMTMGTPATLEINAWERIDPDHIVNEELFIHNRAATQLEYLIVAEPYFMTEDEGVLQLVKGKQQSV
jgi:hypothetical protein